MEYPSSAQSLSARTTAAIGAHVSEATHGSVCSILKDDPISLLPKAERQTAAFRLIYQLPRFLAKQSLRSAPAVFATWLFGDLNAKVLPYPRELQLGDRRRTFGECLTNWAEYESKGIKYRPYKVSYSALEGSQSLRRVHEYQATQLSRYMSEQTTKYLSESKPDTASRVLSIDQYALIVWKALRVRLLQSRTTATPPQVNSGWLPLPSDPVNFSSDLDFFSQSTKSHIGLSEGAVIFGRANSYPFIRGTIKRLKAEGAWEFTATHLRFEILDRFSFQDRESNVPMGVSQPTLEQWLHGLLRERPNVLKYPNVDRDSQLLGFWDTSGRLQGLELRGESIELLNQSFREFADEVGAFQSNLRRAQNCTCVSELECKDFDLHSVSRETPLTTPVKIAFVLK